MIKLTFPPHYPHFDIEGKRKRSLVSNVAACLHLSVRSKDFDDNDSVQHDDGHDLQHRCSDQ